MMKKIFIILCLATTLSACVSPGKTGLDSKNASAIKGQAIASSIRTAPDFSVRTPGKAMFGLIGASLMVSEGNSLITQHKVLDPAVNISGEIMNHLVQSHSAIALALPIAVTLSRVEQFDDDEKLAAAAFGKAKYLLHVQTTIWNAEYYPTAWGSYRVNYSANARLIDVEKKTSVAYSFCRKRQFDKENAPSYEALFEKEATLLKNTVNLLAKECSSQFIAEMFP